MAVEGCRSSVVRVDGVNSPGGITRAAWRATQNHIYVIRTTSDEVGTGDDTTKRYEAETTILAVGLPYVGTSIDLSADRECAQVLTRQIGQAGNP